MVSVLRERHEVWVVAPADNRSGVSHGISMSNQLVFREVGHQEHSCSGFPVDCTIIGSQALMPFPPDAVISGINRGANLGTDIMFSGTAAAARQASFTGIPGIAASIVGDETHEFNWEPLSRFILNNLEQLISLCARDVFVNINAHSLSSYKGAVLTSISRREYRDNIKLTEGEDGAKYSDFKGGRIVTTGDGRSDWELVERGFIAVSRVFAQPVEVPYEGEGAELIWQIQ